MTAQQQPRLMTTEQAAVYLGLPSSGASRQKKSKGHIPESVTRKVGGSVLYDRVALDKWLDEQEARYRCFMHLVYRTVYQAVYRRAD